jgi:hypothetical protein
MGFTILLYLTLGASILLIVLLIRRRSRIFRELEFERMRASIGTPTEPDFPVPFGYKCAWYAVSTEDTLDLVQVVGLKKFKKSTWAYGIEMAYEQKIFISPPVEGWTFIVGSALAPEGERTPAEEISPLLTLLSSRYGAACYFATHRVIEYHAWAKAEHGNITRAFAYNGELGEIVWDYGPATDAEVDIRTGFSEDAVMQVAGGWSVSPASLNAGTAPPGLGYLGASMKPDFQSA